MAPAPTQPRSRHARRRHARHRARPQHGKRPASRKRPAKAAAAPVDGHAKVDATAATAEGTPAQVPLKAGLLVVHLPESDPAPLMKLAQAVAKHGEAELSRATGRPWTVAVPLPRALDEGGVHREGDFLSKGMTTMAQGLLDVVVVLTDSAVSARDKAIVHGSHSRTARVAVMSVRRLLEGEDGDAVRGLEDAGVEANAKALFLHLMGHMTGLVHQWEQGDVMAPFRFTPGRGEARFSDRQAKRLKRKARKVPDQKVAAAGLLMSSVFHVISALRNLGEVVVPTLRARAFLLPLQMPTMATAALIPTIVLVFTAEIWDVAFHMPDRTAYAFAMAVVVLGSFYLAAVQDLFFPRKERETLTEHAAVVNTVLWVSMLQALIGLFVVIGLFVWALEAYVFPEALMQKWTGLETFATRADRIRLAVFISTLGTMTAAMGGALDRKAVVRNLALFSDRA